MLQLHLLAMVHQNPTQIDAISDFVLQYWMLTLGVFMFLMATQRDQVRLIVRTLRPMLDIDTEQDVEQYTVWAMVMIAVMFLPLLVMHMVNRSD